jgi:hypothetical protein
VINTTGASGSLTVTGSGDVTQGGDSSGGLIQNLTGDGVVLTNTLSPSFTNMTIRGTTLGSFTGSGIRGTLVTNFTFKNGSMSNIGHFPDDSNTFFDESNILLGYTPAGTERNVSGVVTITNNILNTAVWHGVDIHNYNGTISDLTITGNSFTSGTTTGSPSGQSKGSAIRIQQIGSASVVSNLTKATIANNVISGFPGGAGIQVHGGNSGTGSGGTVGTPGDATNVISITGNRIAGFSAANKMGTSSIIVSCNGQNAGSRSRCNYIVSDNGTVANPLANMAGSAIGMGNNGNATATVTMNNNRIVANNTVGSNGIGGGNGIVSSSSETPDLTWTITNNNISSTDGNGILAVGRGVTGLMKVTIKSNTVGAPLTGARPGIRVDAGNASSIDDAVCVDIQSNTSGASGGVAGIGIRKQGTTAATNDFGIEGLSPSPATFGQAEDYVAGLNPGSVMGLSGDSATMKRVISLSGGNYVSCTSAP